MITVSSHVISWMVTSLGPLLVRSPVSTHSSLYTQVSYVCIRVRVCVSIKSRVLTWSFPKFLSHDWFFQPSFIRFYNYHELRRTTLTPTNDKRGDLQTRNFCKAGFRKKIFIKTWNTKIFHIIRPSDFLRRILTQRFTSISHRIIFVDLKKIKSEV